MITLDDVQAAAERIAPYVKRTPQWKNESLSKRLGTHIYLKMELFQESGSFKPRGAFNQMLVLSAEERERGVATISGGNFAQGAAYASHALNVDTIICMPQNAPASSIKAAQDYGAQVELLPDVGAAFDRFHELVAAGRTGLHPFDNPHQMAGNGTVALEIYEDLPQITDIVVSIGGGGLMTGVIVVLKTLKPSVRIWGVETEGAAGMQAALAAGQVVNITPTSLSKTLGAPYVAQTALEAAQRHLEALMVISDAAAIEAQQLLIERAKIIAELAASCTLAAAERIKANFDVSNHVVLLLCGGNDSVANLVQYAALV